MTDTGPAGVGVVDTAAAELVALALIAQRLSTIAGKLDVANLGLAAMDHRLANVERALADLAGAVAGFKLPFPFHK